VAHNDIKFAFKSARDAIISQITLTEEASNGLKKTCLICFEDKVGIVTLNLHV
jgi:hypothetical protein